MEIMYSYPKEMHRFELHQMVNNPDGLKMESLEGVQKADAVVMINGEDRLSGETMQKIFIKVDGKVYGSISASFMRTFQEFLDAVGDEVTVDKFHVIKKETKAGRTCILFCADSVKEV